MRVIKLVEGRPIPRPEKLCVYYFSYHNIYCDRPATFLYVPVDKPDLGSYFCTTHYMKMAKETSLHLGHWYCLEDVR